MNGVLCRKPCAITCIVYTFYRAILRITLFCALYLHCSCILSHFFCAVSSHFLYIVFHSHCLVPKIRCVPKMSGVPDRSCVPKRAGCPDKQSAVFRAACQMNRILCCELRTKQTKCCVVSCVPNEWSAKS